MYLVLILTNKKPMTHHAKINYVLGNASIILFQFIHEGMKLNEILEIFKKCILQDYLPLVLLNI